MAITQAQTAFDADALDTAATIALVSERRRAFREIVHAQAVNGKFAQAVRWATDNSDPLMRAAGLLGAAEGALEAVGFSDAYEIKVNRYWLRSSVLMNVAC
ncbi:MAG TPA: hypothetical protein VL086_05180 [Candidatus Nitrosotalea sp.]|nr:hypothetical protein [Candidatus Nitrosotalea sp.]